MNRGEQMTGGGPFRAWLQSPDEPITVELCPCGWAKELGPALPRKGRVGATRETRKRKGRQLRDYLDHESL
jgi:hypothetical protein